MYPPSKRDARSTRPAASGYAHRSRMKYRDQHYVAQFHLANFTGRGGKEDRLWAFDLHARKAFPTTPKKAAFEKDFNRIEVEGVDPNEVEKRLLGRFEDDAAPTLRTWLARGITMGLPGFRVHDGEREKLFAYLGAQLVRGPDAAETVNARWEAHFMRRIQEVARSDHAFRKAQETNAALAEMSRDDVRALLLDPTFRIVIDRATHFRELLPEIVPCAELMGARAWSLAIADAGTDFVCTDCPVVLVASEDVRRPPREALEDPSCVVLAAISRRAALIGMQPSRGESVRFVASSTVPRDVVAELNAIMVGRAHRFVYGSGPDFVIAGEGGKESGVAALFASATRVVRARKRHARLQAKRRTPR
jgi:hypothetical protein